MYAYNDLALNQVANDTAADFVRGKIAEIVEDPETTTRRYYLDEGDLEKAKNAAVLLLTASGAPITFTPRS